MLNIDYGDKDTVSIESIRYLTTELLECLKAQAVWCLGKLGRYYCINFQNRGKDLYNRGLGWTKEEGDIFRNFLDEENLAIKFISQKDIKVCLY